MVLKTNKNSAMSFGLSPVIHSENVKGITFEICNTASF